MIRSRIISTGRHLPEKIVTNEDMTKLVPTSDEWIRERTGIQQRHFVDREIGVSDLGYEAARIALERARLEPADLDFIVFATLSPDYMFPGSGCLLQQKLGVPGIGALDVRTQCTGFIYGLAVADAFIRTGQYRRVLVVGAEVHSTGLEYNERGRHVAVLFGDGAGAAILEANTDGYGVLSTHLHADGRYARELWTENPGSRRIPRLYDGILTDGTCYPQMNGREVFKHAVTKFPEVIMEALQANNLTLDQVALVVPHQANLRITEAVTQRLGLPPEKVFSNIQRYGNTTAASIPIALDEALEQGKIKPGDYLILASFGSGFTWASAAVRW
ncbi:MAG: ketoacyl-ACP synthase III [candidate division KSB1 bacterium]|nr:ketoacyl-ACP synthase III [candidate division KSB1 bacterium]MDZ7274591.1 ketoacyl-ACP synthase III [candidate division KSB1 bacterium]MDZ7284748.1 ketoacyl-ACP synthase III [candidate division KSB1 bacterium]MDZ7297832.1 ketoacyl-ACP synthase III [candidate division KSB1 bacterium]MDZ7308873.1 ketoacyl-ACP synthase III [candidate division KSB1 bacterium]